MSVNGWHADPSLIERYASGSIDQANAASVEEHLIACGPCRALAAQAVDRTRLELVWTKVRAEADRPPMPLVARLLVGLGVREHVARLIAATPALTLSWVLAIVMALGWSVAVARTGPVSPLFFLIVAPLIPLSGVALAYGPGVDPTFEMTVAAPMSSFRLFVLRAGTVLVATIALIGIASTVLPSMGMRAIAWMLPALGVTFAAAALSTWWHSALASASVGTAWIVLSILSYSVHTGQVLSVIITVGAAALIAVRAGTFETRSTR